MLLLILVAFIAGLVTAVSPCVLPILPIVLAAGTGADRRRPYLVIAGLIASFSFFTLASVQIIDALHLPPSLLRDVAIAVIAVFGLTLVAPALAARFERATAALPGIGEGLARSGWLGGLGGFVTGVGLGLVWTPCAGPILGAVTSLAVTAPGSLSVAALVVSYAIGAGLPLLAIAIGGRAALVRLRLRAAAGWAGRALGVLVLITAGLMALGADTAISNNLTSSLPNWIGTLQTLERTEPVKQALFGLGSGAGSQTGKPGNNVGGSGRQSGLPVGPAAPEFAGNGNWLNSKPLTISGLRGKVVLIDFWTYSCINCIRTLPYIESWYQKYAAQGLVIVGVHTPEFAFEHDTGNVAAAIARFGITYPVVQDNDFATWKAFSNSYWPADYLIDANGKLRANHFGEGDYVQTEAEIRSLLGEIGPAVLPSPADSAAPPPISNRQTPETYIGTARAQSFASPERVVLGRVANYTIPAYIDANSFAVAGAWDFEPQYAVSTAAGDRLALNFNARDVYVVLSAGTPVRVTVTVSGTGTVGGTTTEDVAADGSMAVSDARLYHLVHLPALADGMVTITFNAPGVRAYAFTFGG